MYAGLQTKSQSLMDIHRLVPVVGYIELSYITKAWITFTQCQTGSYDDGITAIVRIDLPVFYRSVYYSHLRTATVWYFRLNPRCGRLGTQQTRYRERERERERVFIRHNGSLSERNNAQQCLRPNNNALKWDDHIAATISKASKRIWFLKKLKRVGVSTDDLVYYYQTDNSFSELLYTVFFDQLPVV